MATLDDLLEEQKKKKKASESTKKTETKVEKPAAKVDDNDDLDSLLKKVETKTYKSPSFPTSELPKQPEKPDLLKGAKETAGKVFNKGKDFVKASSKLLFGDVEKIASGEQKPVNYAEVAKVVPGTAKELPSAAVKAFPVYVERTKGQLKATASLLLQNFQEYRRNNLEASSFEVNGQKVSPYGSADDSINKTLSDTANKLRDSAIKNYQKAEEIQKINLPILNEKQFAEGVKDPKWIAANIGINAPQFVTSLGLSVGTTLVTKNPVIGASVGFGQSFALEAGSAYQDAIAADADTKEARNYSFLVGVANGMLDSLPMFRLLNKFPQGDQIKKLAIKEVGVGVMQQMALESGTESLQQIVSNVAAKTYDQNRNLFAGVPESALFGGLFGAFGEGVTTIGANFTRGRFSTESVGKALDAQIDEARKTPEDKRTPEQKEIIAALEQFEKDGNPFEVELLEEEGNSVSVTDPTNTSDTTLTDPSELINRYSPDITRFTTPEQFAKEEFGTNPASKIGFIDPNLITPRDPVDPTTAEFYATQFNNNEVVEPVSVSVENGVLVTTDGSHRVEGAKQAGTKILAVITGASDVPDTISIGELYKQAVDANKANRVEQAVNQPEQTPSEAVEQEKPKEVVSQPTAINTPRDAAKAMIRPYVLRGDSIQSLSASLMGSLSDGTGVNIGGYINGKNITNKKIGVYQFKGQEVAEVFSLTELYNEIKSEAETTQTEEKSVKKTKTKKPASTAPQSDVVLDNEIIAKFSAGKNAELSVLQLTFINGKEVMTTDLEATLVTILPEDTGLEIGVNLKGIEGNPLDIEKVDDSTVKIGSRTLKTTSLEDTPGSPHGDFTSSVSVQLPADRFIADVKRAIAHSSKDDTRPVLEAVAFAKEGNSLTVTGTDGYRLTTSQADATFSGEGKFENILVPNETLKKLLSLLKETKASTVKMEVDLSTEGDEYARFVVAKNVFLYSRLIQGNYPPFKAIIPKLSQSLSVDKNELVTALKEAKEVAKTELGNVVTFKSVATGLEIKAKTAQGEYSKVIPSNSVEVATPESVSVIMPIRADDGNTDPDVVKFNAVYLLDAVTSVKDDRVLMQLQDSSKPATVFGETTIAPVEVKPKIPAGVSASIGSDKIGSFEVVPANKSEASNFKLYEKIQGLIKKYAERIGEQYLPKGAKGVFYHDTRTIRINGMNDLSVAAHEITHYLDKKNEISRQIMGIKSIASNGNPIYDKESASFRKEITDLYLNYYPGARPDHPLMQRAVEGFATLIQKYVEQPTTITKQYPNLVKEFLRPGGKFYKPVIGEVLSDLREIVSEYQGLSALDKIGARVSSSDSSKVDKESFFSFMDKFRTQITHRKYPVEVLGKKSGVGFTAQDPYLWLEMYDRANSVALSNITSNHGYYGFQAGEFTKLYDFNWRTLIDGLSKEIQIDSFGNYLVARRQYFTFLEADALNQKVAQLSMEIKELGGVKEAMQMEGGKELVQEFKKTNDALIRIKKVLENDGMTREEVTDAYLENRERFAKEEEMYDTLVQEDLRFLNSPEVQIINDEEFKKLNEKQGYASFRRDFYDEIAGEDVFSSRPINVGKTKVSSLISRQGSARTIINPLYSALTNHYEMTRKGTKQIVYNKIGRIAVSATFPELFQRQQLVVVPDPNTGRLSFPQEKDPRIIMTRVNYKRVPILTDSVIKSTVDNVLTYQNIGLLENLLLPASRLFTKGTTGLYPAFAISNKIVDQITALAQTQNNYVPLYSDLREFTAAILKQDSIKHRYLMEYLVFGGERQTMFGWLNLSPEQTFKKISKERNAILKLTDLANKGVDILGAPAQYSEIMTRASEYIKAREAGKHQVVALEEAGRVTAPFHHYGNWGGRGGQVLVKSLPFFNPTLQVLDQALRTVGTPKGRKRYAFVATAVTAALVAGLGTLVAFGTDEQKDLYEDLTPEELAKYIWLPNPDGKTLVRIRIPDQMAVFGATINMSLAGSFLGAKYEVADYLDAATSWVPQQFRTLLPNTKDPIEYIGRTLLAWTPQLFKPGILAYANKQDFPKWKDLENLGVQKLPPGLRSHESTSDFAKFLGEKLNFSPIKIDYLITGYFGRAAGFVTSKPGVYNPFSTINRQYYFTSGRRVEAFWEKKTKIDQEYKAMKDGKSKVSFNERMNLNRERNQITAIDNLLDDYRKIDVEAEPVKASELRSKILTRIDELNK